MNSNEVFNKIVDISSDSSTNNKQLILNEHVSDELFRSVLEYAYNPRKIFGVVPDQTWIKEEGSSNFDEQTFGLLDNLIERKLTGNAAREALSNELNRLYKDSATLLVNIIKKDLRAGFSEKLINKAYKGLIPTYPYMRCSLLKDVKQSSFDFVRGVFSQIKMDGLFANGNILETFQFTTRAGSVFPMEHFQEIAESVSHLCGYQTHGELLVEQDGKILHRKIGNGILNSVLKGGKFEENQKPVYVVWDIIPIEEAKTKNKYKVPYYERLALLEKLFTQNQHIRVIEYKVLHSLKECILHAVELIKLGFEGSVFKNPHMIWEDGTSKQQVKVKVEFECDLEITGIREGKKETKYEGRPAVFECQSSDARLKVNCVIKNEKMRDIVESDPNDWIGRIVTLTANDIIDSEGKEEYSLFLPRLYEDVYRTDKLVADDYQRIRDILDSILMGLNVE